MNGERARLLLTPVAIVLLAALPACSVTWRRPEVAPLDPVRVYPVAGSSACDAALQVLEELGLDGKATMRREQACILESDYQRLGTGPAGFDRLQDVAYVGGADLFSHGRYLLTASIREGDDGNARVRFTARIEGYDGGYRTVRSNGAVEKDAFERLSRRLGIDPLDRQEPVQAPSSAAPGAEATLDPVLRPQRLRS